MSTDLQLAQLVQIAGIDGAYGPDQIQGLKALGWEFLNAIRGADLPPGLLQVSFGFVAQQERNLLVALRGTDPRRLLEWLDDAAALPVGCPWGHGLVHAGFLEVYKSLQLVKEPGAKAVALVDYIKGLLDSGQIDHIITTGHSLGGALATLLLDHIETQVPLGVECELESVTFASPRVGDASWSRYYDIGLAALTRRYENPWDLVPNLPGNPPFEHVNARIRLKARFDLDIVMNHLLSTYIELLEKQECASANH